MLLAVATSAGFASCSKDDDEPDDSNQNWNQVEDSEEETPSHSLTKSEVQDLIKKHISVDAHYENYTCYFEIESTIEEELPGHTVKFGIGHGDVDGSTQVSVGNQAYNYHNYTLNGIHIYEFEIPIWFYLMFGVPDSEYDEDYLVTCKMYYNSYLALIKNGSNNDENDLYKAVTKTLSGLQGEVRRNYTPSVQLVLDNKQFFVCKRYGSNLFR